MSAFIGLALCAAMMGKRIYAYITTRFHPVEEKVSLTLIFTISAEKKGGFTVTKFA
jgi:hypothetical protein